MKKSFRIDDILKDAKKDDSEKSWNVAIDKEKKHWNNSSIDNVRLPIPSDSNQTVYSTDDYKIKFKAETNPLKTFNPFVIPVPLPVYFGSKSYQIEDLKKCRRSRTVFTELQVNIWSNSMKFLWQPLFC